MELDALDRLAARAFDGYIVRKDLSLKFKGRYPVPTYVGEFLLGRYCASTDEVEIAEGLGIVESQLQDRIVRPGEEELFKSRARERGTVKLIDLITARLDTASDSYLATLPSLRLSDVRIDAQTVAAHERMLTGGFYAEIQLEYDATIAQQKNGRPFGVASLRPIQLSKRGVLEELAGGGPSSQRSSGGSSCCAAMFVNNSTGQRGLVCQYDVVCFNEISGISFDQKDGVNIMKGYMESGEFSRGRESIRASGSIVMLGNFEVDVEHQQRIGHLFGPLPPEMRNDTAFMDRIHAYLPGWDLPKMDAALLTDHFGLVSDFL